MGVILRINNASAWNAALRVYERIRDGLSQYLPSNGAEAVKFCLEECYRQDYTDLSEVNAGELRLLYNALLKVHESELKYSDQGMADWREGFMQALRSLIALLGEDGRVARPVFEDYAQANRPSVIKKPPAGE